MTILSAPIPLSNEEREVRQKLKDNFKHYASKCLKIRTKAGAVEQLALNRAQLYLHDRLEKQLKEKGMVRALILKGRQQGCCYAPEMRVLCADYQWKPIGSIKVGDSIFGVDENLGLLNKAGRRTERRIRVGFVEAIRKFTHPVFEIELHTGVKLIVTGEHRHLCQKRSADETMWRTVKDTQIGDKIRVLCNMPKLTQNFEDGWFGGILDGEGSFGASPQIRISVSQVDGVVLERAKKYLRDKGLNFYQLTDNRQPGTSSKYGKKPVQCLRIDRLTDVINLLNLTKPFRFVGRPLIAGHKLPKTCPGFDAWAKVVAIKLIGEREVVDLQTSIKTYICEGLVSHNSTYVGGRFYHKATHAFGQRVFILTHEQDATDNLFEMANRYHEHCPPLVRPHTGASNAKELDFDILDSGYRVGTAGSKAVGRSQTLQFFHGSEVAFWPNAESHAAGILQAIPNLPGTETILESTANGMGNYFHSEWQKAEAGLSDYEAIFIPWFWQEEYRKEVPENFALSPDDELYQIAYDLDNEQMAWRASKISQLGELLFMQEYPATAAEAFQLTGHDSFIPPALVLKARKNKCDAYGPLVIGVDPSWGGEDRFSMAWRKGRCVTKLESRTKLLPVDGANWIRQVIDEDEPDRVFIDVGGAGIGTVDILHNWGEPYKSIVKPINFGGTPQDYRPKEKGGPKNRRAEMWLRSKQWLEDVGEAQLPDFDSLQADACAPGFKYDMLGMLLIEAKQDMKKRGLRSPDEWDAIALTFAEPVGEKKKPIEIGKNKVINLQLPYKGGAWMK